MKILAVRGKNLASLEAPFEIDFTAEPLASAGIFAITGQTGSGKSTILDALCLALYDDTPRFYNAQDKAEIHDVGENTIGQSDCRSILRRGAIDGYAEVEFRSLDGDTYRSRWFVTRAGKKATGALGRPSITLHNITANEEVAGGKKEILAKIVTLTGLTFEQFTRAVLLAQGDFAAFLKAKGNDKAELLEKLTGTEIYSRISISIFEKKKAYQLQYEHLQEQIKDIALLTPLQISELEAEKQSLALAAEALNKELELNKVKLKWLDDEKALREKRSEAEKALQTARNAIANAAPRYDYLKKSDVAQSIRDCFTNLQSVKKQIVDNEKAAASENKLWQEANDKSLKLKETVLSLENELQKIEEAWKRYEPEVQKATETDVKIENAAKNETEAQKDCSKAEADKAKTEANINNINKLIDVTEKRHNAEKERFGKMLTAEIAHLRTQLREGEPCPVCGSIEHPILTSVETASVERIAAEWSDCEKNINELNNKLISLQTELKGEQTKLEELTETLKIKADKLNELRQFTQSLKTERAALLKGSSTTDFKNRYVAKKQDVEKQLKESRTAHDTSIRNAAEKEGIVKQLHTSIEEQKRQVAQLNAEKEQWQSAHDATFTDDFLAEILSKTAVWLQNERQALENLHKQENTAQALLTERQDTYSRHLQAETKPSENENSETLTIRKQTVEEELTLNRKREVEIRVAIEKNEKEAATKQKYEKQIADMSVVYENWQKLNELLGSAKGDKFKKIAQEYTLDYLLLYTNKQLQSLSERYELQRVENTLALQIIDRYMLDEVRTVHSLSGGETFLVSLALALGLSSLSSRRMKVESLFIDEGFGSLDAETLRTAMDALENLQNQGRKLGVISHVEEMTERIPVQIRVSKLSNGQSRVEVRQG